MAPVSGRRQEALNNSHVNEHLDSRREPQHPLSRRVTLAEQIQINSKVVHGTPKREMVYLNFLLSNLLHRLIAGSLFQLLCPPPLSGGYVFLSHSDLTRAFLL